MKLNEAQIEDLTGKVFRTIIGNGKDGVLQSELWKELDLTSRDGSRVAIRLEKRALIRREKMLENGRWTYKLFAIKLPVDTSNIEGAPCLTCPVEHMCSLDGSYSPISCNLIEEWLVTSFDTANQKKKDEAAITTAATAAAEMTETIATAPEQRQPARHDDSLATTSSSSPHHRQHRAAATTATAARRTGSSGKK